MGLDVEYNAKLDILTVEGVRFSGDLMRAWGDSRVLPDGYCFQIVQRIDGTLTIKKLEGPHGTVATQK